MTTELYATGCKSTHVHQQNATQHDKQLYMYVHPKLTGNVAIQQCAFCATTEEVCDPGMCGVPDVTVAPFVSDLTGHVWQVFGSRVTWYTKSYQNLTPVGSGRSVVYQVTWLVGWNLTSLFSSNTAISDTNQVIIPYKESRGSNITA